MARRLKRRETVHGFRKSEGPRWDQELKNVGPRKKNGQTNVGWKYRGRIITKNRTHYNAIRSSTDRAILVIAGLTLLKSKRVKGSQEE